MTNVVQKKNCLQKNQRFTLYDWVKEKAAEFENRPVTREAAAVMATEELGFTVTACNLIDPAKAAGVMFTRGGSPAAIVKRVRRLEEDAKWMHARIEALERTKQDKTGLPTA